MANAKHLKALVESYLEGDERRFYSVAMQAAAHEARLGHGDLAEELRSLIDAGKSKALAGASAAVPIARPRGELSSLLSVSYPKTRFADMVLPTKLREQLGRVIREQRHAGRILEHGLAPRRKLLLVGAPGTGKTMTASALAGELGMPLFQVRLDGLLTKFLGETAAKLRQIFDATGHTRGVYFFDEFDAIGSQRGLTNDVGEIRRVLNSFLQMIEQDQSHGLIIAATNHPEILDYALLRRFDDVLHYSLPSRSQIVELLRARSGLVVNTRAGWSSLASLARGLSYSEIARAVEDVQKASLISGDMGVTRTSLEAALGERQDIAGRLKKRR
ncbi:MAG: ATP-binding protein [Gemmatimonadota bacterium]|nr:ATP-binding protein [Gemmatimonadota bacterium]